MKDQKRIWMTVAGVVFSGIGCGFIKAAALGTDPFTGAVTEIGMAAGIQYGTIYVLINGLLLAAVWILDRHYIGIATVVNLFGIGYIVQFVSDGILEASGPLGEELFFRLLLLIFGLLVLCVGTSLYFTSDLGVSAYDAAALILRDRTGRSLRFCRVGTDVLCVAAALALGASVGAGTVITAFCMGPVVEFFNKRMAEPLLKGRIAKGRRMC